MSGGAIIAIVVVVVILAVVAVLVSRLAVRRPAMRKNLGAEYRRLADEMGTRKANAQYDKRRRRVDGLGIKPLSQEQRTLYTTQWVATQETFINDPVKAARAARALVTAVAAERGYDVADSGQLLDDLSVYYGNQLDGYRSALAVTWEAGDTVTEEATEQLRQAMLGYRAMFRELAEISDSDEMAAATAAMATPTAAATTGTGATIGAGSASAQATDAASEAT